MHSRYGLWELRNSPPSAKPTRGWMKLWVPHPCDVFVFVARVGRTTIPDNCFSTTYALVSF
jgi:hypothetical protein